ncbi:transcriptional regulator [Shouchella lehensis]|uniref:Transcriptional regulator n=1 Tax=Shouchella lehensis TaxID=300825 RepID=A0A4Y7WEG6_9BACI|nr:transcriptional regulator [Shouchella lehensis]MBG9783576.1 transcriptional regulator [Shouchella lehensis]TES45669.1 transcriptional regulator [Shouchella lehensis]
MESVKLQKATFKHIEAELYQYPNTVKEIKKRRVELLHPYLEEVDENQGGGVNSVRAISRPTERMATRLTADKRLRNLEEITEAIESVYSDLNDKQKDFVRMRYWSGRNNASPVMIAMETDVSERTVHNYKRKIVEAIGEKIGWL